MAEHTFSSELVEEFYNSCHLKDSGRFCGRSQGKKGAIRVPMSENARRSNAILRRLASDRKSKGYQHTKHAVAGLKGADTKANKAKVDPRPTKEALDTTKKYGTGKVALKGDSLAARRAAREALEAPHGRNAAGVPIADHKARAAAFHKAREKRLGL